MNILTTDAGTTIVRSILTSDDTVTRYNLVPAQAERVAQMVFDFSDVNEIHRQISYVTADPHGRSMLVAALTFAINEAKRQISALLESAAAEGLVK